MGIDPSKYVEPADGNDEIVQPGVPADPGQTIQMTQAEFVRALGQAIAEGNAASAPPRKMTFGEYARSGASPFHPKGAAAMPKALRTYMQNGWIMPLTQMHDEEIRLLNRITHSGRYLDRQVEVVLNTDNAEETVDIRFSNTVEKAFELKGVARNFTEMLRQVVDAQEMEDLEQEERNTSKAKGRAFGDNKVSQAARAAAAAK